MAEIKAGDTVQLMSGGPKMTVERAEEVDGVTTVWCQWFEEGKGRKKNYDCIFPLSSLIDPPLVTATTIRNQQFGLRQLQR